MEFNESDVISVNMNYGCILAGEKYYYAYDIDSLENYVKYNDTLGKTHMGTLVAAVENNNGYAFLIKDDTNPNVMDNITGPYRYLYPYSEDDKKDTNIVNNTLDFNTKTKSKFDLSKLILPNLKDNNIPSDGKYYMANSVKEMENLVNSDAKGRNIRIYAVNSNNTFDVKIIGDRDNKSHIVKYLYPYTDYQPVNLDLTIEQCIPYSDDYKDNIKNIWILVKDKFQLGIIPDGYSPFTYNERADFMDKSIIKKGTHGGLTSSKIISANMQGVVIIDTTNMLTVVPYKQMLLNYVFDFAAMKRNTPLSVFVCGNKWEDCEWEE